MSGRRFDPEAADEFISFLREEMATIQNSVIESYFKNGGPLGRMPAFGVGGNSQSLLGDYTRFHSGAWTDIQNLLASYQGIIDALDDIKEANADTEDAGTADFDGQL